MTLLFQQPPTAPDPSRGFDVGDLTLGVFVAALAIAGAMFLWIGGKARLRRRPVVIPARWIAPIGGLFLLEESGRYFGRAPSSTPWGSAGDWTFVALALLLLLVLVGRRMRATTRNLYIGGLHIDRGRQLARAVLKALDPGAKVVADESQPGMLRAGKRGPGVAVRPLPFFRGVVFHVPDSTPDEQRASYFQAITGCLDAEELALESGVARRLAATGAVVLLAAVVVVATNVISK